jgi:hypothetical protein
MKPIVLIMIIALVGGSIVGAAMMGVIDIPGISPTKKKVVAQAAYGSDKDKGVATGDAKAKVAAQPATQPVAPPKPVKKPKPAPVVSVSNIDPEAGHKKVAKLWNEMTPETLMPIVAKGWKDGELAQILVKMDSSKVAQLLTALPADRASKLTKAIQKESSKLPASK